MILISNGGGNKLPRNEPPRGGGSGLPGSGGNNPLGGGGNKYPTNQNQRPYVARLVGTCIGPTWNMWYLSWCSIQSPIHTKSPAK